METDQKQENGKILDLEGNPVESDVSEENATDDLAPELTSEELLEQQLKGQEEKFLRLVAEMDNLRKRHEKQLSDMQKFAVEKVMKEVLPVLDSFEQALGTGDGSESEFHKGMFLVRDQLLQCLQRNGLQQIESVGKPFDPNFHQAIKTTPVEDSKEEVVLAEFQKGYTLSDRLIRAAMVEVSTGD